MHKYASDQYLQILRRKRWVGVLGVLTTLIGYFPHVLPHIIGENKIYWFTMHNKKYERYHTKDIEQKFNRRISGLRTLFIRNNADARIVNSGMVSLIICPLPSEFVAFRGSFEISKESELKGNCGVVRNARPIIPGRTSRLYFFSVEAPYIVEDGTSTPNLTSGERMLNLHLGSRFFMVFGGLLLFAPVFELLRMAIRFVIRRLIYSKFEGGIMFGAFMVILALPLLYIMCLGPMDLLTPYQLVSDYDLTPSVLCEGMELMVP